MKITAIEITQHQLPLDPPFHPSWSSKARMKFDATLVRVHTDEGLTGIGSLSVMDRAGVIRHSTIPAIVGQSRKERWMYQRLVEDPHAGLVADRPFRGLNDPGIVFIPLGQRLTTALSEIGTGEGGRRVLRFETVDRDGTTVIRNGFAEVSA